MPGGESPLTIRARLVNIRYFPNPLGIVPLCSTLFMPGGESPLTIRARLVNIRYFPNPLGIVPLCSTLFTPGGESPLTIRTKLVSIVTHPDCARYRFFGWYRVFIFSLPGAILLDTGDPLGLSPTGG